MATIVTPSGRRTRMRTGPRRPAFPVVLALTLLPAVGCGTVKTTGTARTGTEQLLLTNAWDSALAKLDFRPLTGVPVYLDTTNVTAVDQGWVVSSLRQALLTQGVLLRAKPEQAQWIVEARVGAYGTDAYNVLVGIPQTTVPPTFTGIPSGTIPEMSLLKKSHQEGIAKLALFAYDRASGQYVWSSGPVIATSSAKDLYVGGVGPIQGGTIRGGTKFIGTKIPMPSEALGPIVNTPGKAKEQDGATAASPLGIAAPPPSTAISDTDPFGP
jgi:hypothetical protein